MSIKGILEETLWSTQSPERRWASSKVTQSGRDRSQVQTSVPPVRPCNALLPWSDPGRRVRVRGPHRLTRTWINERVFRLVAKMAKGLETTVQEEQLLGGFSVLPVGAGGLPLLPGEPTTLAGGHCGKWILTLGTTSQPVRPSGGGSAVGPGTRTGWSSDGPRQEDGPRQADVPGGLVVGLAGGGGVTGAGGQDHPAHPCPCPLGWRRC